MCNACEKNSKYWTPFETLMESWVEGDKSQLIPTLQKLQDAYGYLPQDVLERLSEKTGIFASQIMGVASFYSQFRLEPMGKHIVKICFGTACHVLGAENVADAICRELGVGLGKTTEDGLFTVESVACIGCCSLAPVIMIGEETHGRLNPDTARSVIRDFRKKEVEAT